MEMSQESLESLARLVSSLQSYRIRWFEWICAKCKCTIYYLPSQVGTRHSNQNSCSIPSFPGAKSSKTSKLSASMGKVKAQGILKLTEAAFIPFSSISVNPGTNLQVWEQNAIAQAQVSADEAANKHFSSSDSSLFRWNHNFTRARKHDCKIMEARDSNASKRQDVARNEVNVSQWLQRLGVFLQGRHLRNNSRKPSSARLLKNIQECKPGSCHCYLKLYSQWKLKTQDLAQEC